MQIKPLNLGNTQIKNNVFLAPMAGYTDYAFRHLIIGLGAGLTFTELVSAKGLIYNGKGSKELLYSGKDIENTAVQLFGADEYFLRKAIESEDLKDFKIVDINMGCPVPKVYNNGEGSALLKDIKKAEKIVKECVKSQKTITIKIRTGLKKGDDVASSFAKMAEDCGAKAITVHGRVKEAYYSGEVDYKAIEKAKKSVNIPVIANGGIFSVKDADKMIENTGADGVMIARGAVFNPFLFSDLLNIKTDLTLKDFMIKHAETEYPFYKDKTAQIFRKYANWYFKGEKNAKELRSRFYACSTYKELMETLKNL